MFKLSPSRYYQFFQASPSSQALLAQCVKEWGLTDVSELREQGWESWTAKAIYNGKRAIIKAAPRDVIARHVYLTERAEGLNIHPAIWQSSPYIILMEDVSGYPVIHINNYFIGQTIAQVKKYSELPHPKPIMLQVKETDTRIKNWYIKTCGTVQEKHWFYHAVLQSKNESTYMGHGDLQKSHCFLHGGFFYWLDPVLIQASLGWILEPLCRDVTEEEWSDLFFRNSELKKILPEIYLRSVYHAAQRLIYTPDDRKANAKWKSRIKTLVSVMENHNH